MINRYLLVCFMVLATIIPLQRAEARETAEAVNVQELVMEHTADAHDWHITTINGHHVSIPMPVIAKSSTGWHVFMSSRFHESPDGVVEGMYVNKDGKLKEQTAAGEASVFDISITKNVLQLWIVVAILLTIFLYCANWYKKRKPEDDAPKGFVGCMEMIVMFVYNDIIKEAIDAKHCKFFAPYLLTVFFFVFVSNLIGLIPIFPGGANLTGNITITCFLAVCTMLLTNLFGNKHYWKDIFWPDVPWWLKFPIPVLPVIELFGIFTKPFALMVRLFANIFGGHAVAISLTCVIFITFQTGIGTGASISPISVFLMIFMDFLELLVAFIQAFVFTMLSAVFIGLSHQEGEHSEKEISK